MAPRWGALEVPQNGMVKDVLAQEVSYPINIDEVAWEDTPKGWYLIDVKYKVLWKDEATGAMYVLFKVPAGEYGATELPHTHPNANQMGFVLAGEMERPDGARRTFGDGRFNFRYSPRGLQHGPRRGSALKVTQDLVILQYFDGPVTKLNEGETEELILE